MTRQTRPPSPGGSSRVVKKWSVLTWLKGRVNRICWRIRWAGWEEAKVKGAFKATARSSISQHGDAPEEQVSGRSGSLFWTCHIGDVYETSTWSVWSTGEYAWVQGRGPGSKYKLQSHLCINGTSREVRWAEINKEVNVEKKRRETWCPSLSEVKENEEPERSEENQAHMVSQKPSEGSVLKGSMCHMLLLDQVGWEPGLVQLNGIFDVIGLRKDGLREIRDENT